MEKELSIIIPTYNMEALLRHTLDSLLVTDENMKKLEVLIINDGSKDSSLAIAQEYESKHPNTFRAINKPNGNYGSCVNRGLAEATGKYIKVLDADDSMDTDNLNLFIKYLSSIDAEVIISDFNIVNEVGAVTKKVSFTYPTDCVFGIKEINNRNIFYLWHHAVTYKTSLLKSINYTQTEGCSYSDDEWVVKPIASANIFAYYNHTLYLYLIGREGQTVNAVNFSKLKDGKLKVMNSMLAFYNSAYKALSEQNQLFIDNKLAERLDSLYKNLLYRFYEEKSVPAVIELDRKLAGNFQVLYNKLNEVSIKYIGVHYVNQWRKSNYDENVFILKLMRLLKK